LQKSKELKEKGGAVNVKKKEIISQLRHLHELIRILESHESINVVDSNLKSKDVSTLLGKSRKIIELLIDNYYKQQNMAFKMNRIINLTKILNQVVILLVKLRDLLTCTQLFYHRDEYINQTRSAA